MSEATVGGVTSPAKEFVDWIKRMRCGSCPDCTYAPSLRLGNRADWKVAHTPPLAWWRAAHSKTWSPVYVCKRGHGMRYLNANPACTTERYLDEYRKLNPGLFSGEDGDYEPRDPA